MKIAYTIFFSILGFASAVQAQQAELCQGAYFTEEQGKEFPATG